jgi:hypothetical protein
LKGTVPGYACRLRWNLLLVIPDLLITTADGKNDTETLSCFDWRRQFLHHVRTVKAIRVFVGVLPCEHNIRVVIFICGVLFQAKPI